jgi:hypothetical protein
MPRTNYVPDRHRPVGFAFPYIRDRTDDDMPTVEVDLLAKGLKDGLIEAVITALELWNPQFDHWEDPPPKPGTDQQRRIPVFRGKHAHKVLKFKDDVVRYVRNHPSEQSNAVWLRIASKYVHIRPRTPGPNGFPHFDATPYTRDVIRPYIRRSDPEWDRPTVTAARYAYLDGDESEVSRIVLKMLRAYDENHATVLSTAYHEELDTLINDNAPLWEYWRLVAFYVAEICDADYKFNPEAGLDDRRSARATVR